MDNERPIVAGAVWDAEQARKKEEKEAKRTAKLQFAPKESGKFQEEILKVRNQKDEVKISAEEHNPSRRLKVYDALYTVQPKVSGLRALVIGIILILLGIGIILFSITILSDGWILFGGFGGGSAAIIIGIMILYEAFLYEASDQEQHGEAINNQSNTTEKNHEIRTKSKNLNIAKVETKEISKQIKENILDNGSRRTFISVWGIVSRIAYIEAFAREDIQVIAKEYSINAPTRIKLVTSYGAVKEDKDGSAIFCHYLGNDKCYIFKGISPFRNASQIKHSQAFYDEIKTFNDKQNKERDNQRKKDDPEAYANSTAGLDFGNGMLKLLFIIVLILVVLFFIIPIFTKVLIHILNYNI